MVSGLETKRGKYNRALREPERALWVLKWPLNAYSGCSGRAQVKAAAAHVQTLKRKKRKKKLSLTYVEIFYFIFRIIFKGVLNLL